MAGPALDALTLAALLASRVCHDVIAPVGAIQNGLELLDEEEDEAMRLEAMALIRSSAESAANKLRFARMAFGASGAAGMAIDLSEAERTARHFVVNDRTTLAWEAPRSLMHRDRTKVLMNLVALAALSAPRGGHLAVNVSDPEGPAVRLAVAVTADLVRVPATAVAALAGEAGEHGIDPHTIQPYYAGLLARSCGLAVRVETGDGTAQFVAEGAN